MIYFYVLIYYHRKEKGNQLTLVSFLRLEGIKC